ncbi:MAG: cardiolipin synthase [Prolixibacteraceae bacterium]|nr:cardiolipin synthase [Prolixibacteraceae bacterium]
MNTGLDFWTIFSLLFLVTAIPVAVMIILEKRSPYKTVAWILVLILIPILGLFFYLIFGQEYRKRKLYSRKGVKSLGEFRKLSSKQLRKIDQTHFSFNGKRLKNENIIRLLLNNSNALLTTGNQLKILNNGNETFQAIFQAIKNAKHHVHLEYYIFSDDKIGNQLKNLLIEKSLERVEIRIIIDDVGSWGLRKKFISELQENGIEIYSFMEVRFPRLTARVNFRNHRKILIVDGEIGFTGGINIADRYIEGIKGIGRWRDTHLQIEGDAVACLQVVFAADWYFVINENLAGRKYFPALTERDGGPVQISAGGPDSDWENIGQAFFAAITSAKNKVYIVTPYLMPPLNIISALKIAALSSVDVRILIPEKSDAIIPKWSSFSYVEEFLEAGIKIYFYQPGFIHSKYLIVDDLFSSIGTTNFDFRSLETNFEVNAFIYHEHFTRTLEKHFIADLQNSSEIKLVEWKKRPWHYKLRESMAHIVSPLL